ncbi:MAG: metal-dependent hydrolase [Promethearchaeota archaeon]
MNELTHFFTGYLLARAMKREHDEFPTFFLGIAALTPDFDAVVHLFVPSFHHGVFTHTILGGLLFAAIFVAATVAILGRSYLAEAGVTVKELAALAVVGLASHLVLDVFTFSGQCATDAAHQYFWPVWTFSFHMDCIWGVDYLTRVLVEVFYSAALAAVVAWDWRRGGNDPFHALKPARWWTHARGKGPAGVRTDQAAPHPPQVPRRSQAYLWACVAILAVFALGYAF